AITGMPYHDLIGTFYQQDVDTARLMADVAYYTERIMGPAHVESVTDLAVRMAISKRGVAHLAFPNDLQEKPADEDKVSSMNMPHHTSAEWTPPLVVPTPTDLSRAAEVLNAGQKIAILVGSGARDARREIEQLAELLGAPVAKAFLGKDVLPDDSPYTTGTIGVFGTKPTADMLNEADTFFMIGTSFPYISYLPKPDKVRGVQIDNNPARIGLRFPVEVGLVGDARETLRALIPLFQPKAAHSLLEKARQEMQEWWQLIEERGTSTDVPMRPQVLAWELGKQLNDDAIICVDSGSNTFYAAREIKIKGQQRMSTSGLMASMACGLTYAIGAQVAFPDRQVVAFVGDGGFTMLMGELATCMKYKLPIKVFIVKNNALGMIRWEQMMYAGNPEYGVELQDIDFAKFAEACGATGLHVEQPQDVPAAITKALATPGPVVLEAVTDPYEPMIPGNLKPELAQKMAEALKSGQPNAHRIGITLFRDIAEDFEPNSETLQGALEEKTPQVLQDAQQNGHGGNGQAAGQEPQAVLQEQQQSAQERKAAQ
ncbi:MAG: hypothetical protein JOZ57_02925, partial [Abitibacteriaceae bacterium]|nr:hypothetical protein [Abditibacteriaceae bacterium]